MLALPCFILLPGLSWLGSFCWQRCKGDQAFPVYLSEFWAQGFQKFFETLEPKIRINIWTLWVCFVVKKKSKSKIDKYQWLTDKFIDLLEKGVHPWRRDWQVGGAGTIQNFLTQQPYKGKNPWILGLDSLARGAQPYYCGRSQGQEKGWKIKKGSKAAFVTYANYFSKENEKGEVEVRPFVKWYPVFNIEDWTDRDAEHKVVDFLPETRPPLNQDDRLASVDTFIKSTGADVETRGSQPMYSPTLDKIAMPPFGDFSNAPAYYATLLHELVHWSGHEERCDRQFGNFGTPLYAREELIAELGAAYLCQDLGVSYDIENHASYLEGWLKAAKQDKMFLYRSMSKAQEAVETIQQIAGQLSAEPDASQSALGQRIQEAVKGIDHQSVPEAAGARVVGGYTRKPRIHTKNLGAEL